MTPCLRIVPAALLLLCTLTACGGGSVLKQPDPVKHLYVLQVSRPMHICETGDNGVLKIRRVRVAPSFMSRELVYRTGPESYETDYYNQFLVQPQDMLTESLLTWFAGSRIFSHVVPGTSAMRQDYVLEASVTRLHGDFSEPERATAVLELQVFLLQDQLADYKVLFGKDYVQTIALEERSAKGLVQGLQQALQAVLEEAEADVQRAVLEAEKAGAGLSSR